MNDYFNIRIQTWLIVRYLPLQTQVTFARCNKTIHRFVQPLLNKYRIDYNASKINKYQFIDITFVQWLIEFKGFYRFNNALINACENGALDIVRYIIYIVNHMKYPLRILDFNNAIEACCKNDHIECARYLLNYKNDKNDKNDKTIKLSADIIKCIYANNSIKCMELINDKLSYKLSLGAYVGACIARNEQLMVKIALTNNIELEDLTFRGIRAACESDNLILLQKLLPILDQNNHCLIVDGLATSANYGSINCLQYLLRYGKICNDLMLYFACDSGSYECVKLVVDNIDKDYSMIDWFHALMIAYENGNNNIITLIKHIKSQKKKYKHYTLESSGRLDILILYLNIIIEDQFSISSIKDVCSSLFRSLCYNGYIDCMDHILQFIKQKNITFNDKVWEDTFTYMCNINHISSALYLLKNHNYASSELSEGLNKLCVDGNLEFIRELCKVYPFTKTDMITYSIIIIMINSHLDCLQFIMQQYDIDASTIYINLQKTYNFDKNDKNDNPCIKWLIDKN